MTKKTPPVLPQSQKHQGIKTGSAEEPQPIKATTRSVEALGTGLFFFVTFFWRSKRK